MGVSAALGDELQRAKKIIHVGCPAMAGRTQRNWTPVEEVLILFQVK